MIDRDLITRKEKNIQEYLGKLEPLLASEARQIIDDEIKLHAIERLFQLTVDTAIDINTHIITELNFIVPDDYYSTFITLGENKVLSPELARKIARSVGLRNMIIHKYGEVDIKRMVDEIKANIGDYIEYKKQVKYRYIPFVY